MLTHINWLLKSRYRLPSGVQKYTPLARATGIGSTAPWTDHSKIVCCFESAITSSPVIDTGSQGSPSRLRRKMLFVPRDRPIDLIDDVLRFADAVPLARIPHHHDFGADVLQRDVELLRFGDRHVVVVLAVH